jgi:uncharacterized protein (DUF1330 family)
MVAYVVSLNDITDPAQFAEYAARARVLTPANGGRVIASAEGHSLEGDDVPARVLIIEFPSRDHAMRFYRSAEYEAARKLRANAGRVRLLLLDALPG